MKTFLNDNTIKHLFMLNFLRKQCLLNILSPVKCLRGVFEVPLGGLVAVSKRVNHPRI